MSRSHRASLALLALLGVCACQSAQSAMHGASDAARRTARLGWFMASLAALVFVVVLVILALAIGRRRDRDPDVVDLGDPGPKFVLYGGALFPGVVLTTLFVFGLATLGMFPHEEPPAYAVSVTGHRWWWEVRYAGATPSDAFATANELHIPVGKPVRVSLTSGDVIHSFWVPQLQGKLDVIPGDTNVLTLEADRAGVYRGQCAEYCGVQHAHMGIVVVAEPPAAFEAWLSAQREAPPPASTAAAAEGERLFVGGPCAMCHTVRGTPAQGRVAPDLTHFGSRRTIAAGTLPNTLGNLEAWIVNAQGIKPGALMPTITQYDGRELRALATYLRGLR